ncbi:hypothetical protein OHS71_27690 [Streptomyces sp. NBC_00377]|uniref:hypothetical protein n=1 Tax=unclassified Streptomyces TaxID=2593676 RepID=UPI002E1BFA7A|nr:MULTISPECIES: hypothetical protein [unclassified Streptomyces]
MFALCLVSALQLLVLRNTPFGVTGASPVVNAVASKVSLETHSYADESAVMKAIGQSKLYGAYLPGKSSDTLVVVPAKSRRDIGPFLPPRNAYILLRNSIYFDGHGTTQALVVLLVYLIIPAIAPAFLDRFRTPEIPVTRETEAEATALTVPVGGLP